MSDITTIEGPKGRSVTFEPCPVNYFPNDSDMTATRMTIFTYGDPVFFLDFIIQEDTRYTIYFEVFPDYREGRWLNYTEFDGGEPFDKGIEIFKNCSRIVHLNITPNSAPSVLEGIKRRQDLTDKDLVLASKIYLSGALMDVIDVNKGSE